MLYEGYLKIASECGEEVEKECLKNVVEELLEKDVKNFKFASNDTKKKDLKGLIEDLAFKDDIEDLTIDIMLSKDKKGNVKEMLVGNKHFLYSSENKSNNGENIFSFQIMKADRYIGISSTEVGKFRNQITTYSDKSGTLVFFAGLISSYVTTVEKIRQDSKKRKSYEYYFLFFDIDTLVSKVLEGNLKNWMNIKDKLAVEIKEIIDEYGGINDEAIILTAIFNTHLLEELRVETNKYVGFRLVKVVLESGRTYKVYTDLPLRVYQRRHYVSLEEKKKEVEKINRIIKTLNKSAGKFFKNPEEGSSGYHAFMALRYLYLYVSTENPVYLNMMYRELFEAYISAKGSNNINERENALRYLECFLRPTIKL